MYEQITRNKWKSVLLVLVVLVVAAGLGYVFGLLFDFGVAGVIVALLIAAGMSFASYRFGDRIVLRASRARLVTPEEHPRLHNIVDGLCIAAGIPKPAVYVIPEKAPNAFATGRNPEHASIAVTEGLLETLNRVELEGVIAHELSHVKNRDILVGTLVATLVGVVVLLADWMRRAFFWGGGRRGDRDRGGGLGIILVVIALALSILAPLMAQLIRFAVSRKREYLADADGALLTRYPPGLAAALRKIAASANQMRVANNATAHLWFSQPSRKPGEGVSRIERLFSTHPPIEERIRILQEM
ncbi:MAG TPA: M48 family metallopeptidase [Actinomycetota bacterium]|nr:M48 family metallopeptidase [Actinomycetota bacterium]